MTKPKVHITMQSITPDKHSSYDSFCTHVFDGKECIEPVMYNSLMPSLDKLKDYLYVKGLEIDGLSITTRTRAKSKEK